MLTFYCPHCWKIISKDESICPYCEAELMDYQDISFEEKLLSSLHHSVFERRIMAAQILGNIHSQEALKEFQIIIENGETNYYILRTILIATAKINHPDRMNILRTATTHSSNLVSELARSLVNLVESGKEIEEWDHNTG